MIGFKEKEGLITLCQDLIQINSTNPPGNENEVVDYCEGVLKDIGAKTQIIQHTPGRSSLIAQWTGKQNGKQILIVCHADTVPVGNEDGWKTHPFSAEIIDGKIIGRGASDMKGGIAAVLSALRQLSNWGDLENSIIFALTADEESDGIGVQEIIKNRFNITPDFVMVPEPTENHIAIAEKGTLWLELVVLGKSCHASSPDLGINAIERLVELLKRIGFSQFENPTHPLLGQFTSCVTEVRGGIKINIVPDICQAALDIRFLPGQSADDILRSVQTQIHEIFRENDKCNVQTNVLLQRAAIETKESAPMMREVIPIIKEVKKDARIIGVPYFTDAAVIIQRFNVPFIICGPGERELMHADNEYIAVERLIESYEIYTKLLKTLIKLSLLP